MSFQTLFLLCVHGHKAEITSESSSELQVQWSSRTGEQNFSLNESFTLSHGIRHWQPPSKIIEMLYRQQK